MRAYDLIWKKREGGELSPEEIEFLISGFVKGEIPDYQMSAWCMAVLFRGMTFDECTALTLAMAHSGEMVDLSSIPGVKVDKHSTGGVGDKTSLVLLPLVAACGIPVAKMSGRGLGHTGGTLDKLDAISGFNSSLSREALIDQVSRIGVAIAGQTADLVPADKKLYALRDLTATVESIPLIASSIVSKKLASGADAVVLDVKFGDGAFMRKYETALELAKTMVEIGNRSGRQFKAILSDMNQPLGRAVGNSLEVKEAIETLKGDGPSDLTELCMVIGGYMVWLAKRANTPDEGKKMISDVLYGGQGLSKFRELLIAQGGDPDVIDDLSLLPSAPVAVPVLAEKEGWVEKINCRNLGLVAMELGAGRQILGESIRPEVGLITHAKVGNFVGKGAVIAEVYAMSETEAGNVKDKVRECYRLSMDIIKSKPLIAEIV